MSRFLTIGVLAVLGLAALSSKAQAQASPLPDQIQEDWQLVIGTPDPTGAGPQLSTALSPVTDGSTPFFVFNLNYRETPTFAPGGLEVQVWSGDQMVSGATKGTAQCTTTGE